MGLDLVEEHGGALLQERVGLGHGQGRLGPGHVPQGVAGAAELVIQLRPGGVVVGDRRDEALVPARGGDEVTVRGLDQEALVHALPRAEVFSGGAKAQPHEQDGPQD